MEKGDAFMQTRQSEPSERLYQVGAFAALTGVSVRTLHHYDHLGLLRPSGRSEAGYRLYTGRDVLRLQQILTLRYLGFALKHIGEILSQPDFDMLASLHIQRRALRDRITELERIEAVLGELLARCVATGEWSWELVTRATGAFEAALEEREKRMSEYYTPEELQQRLAELGKTVTPNEIQRAEQEWVALVREVRANRGLDVASPQAQALADRWNALVQEMDQQFHGDQRLANSIRRNYEQGNYMSIPDAPTMEDFAFIARVNAARQG